MRIALWLALAAVTGSTTACDTREAYPDPGPRVVRMHVVNANAHDVNLYVIRNDERLRVAYVWSGEDQDVELGSPLIDSGDFMIEAYALGLDAIYRTPPISPLRETFVQVSITADFFASTFSVSYGEEETT